MFTCSRDWVIEKVITLIKTIQWVLLLGIVLSARFAAAADHAIILQYHHVSDETPAVTSISPELFEWHLEYLQQQGFTIWPLSRISRYLEEDKALPDKCVAITFDDAYRSIYDTAFPLLKEKNWPFTLFINTAAVGKGGISLSWDEIREMDASIAEIGNHTHSHAHLIRYQEGESPLQWRERVTGDIQMAQQIIDQQLAANNGLPPRLFAYPYGEYSIALYQLIKELGYVAVGQHSGPIDANMPRELLARFPMGGIYTKKSQLIEKLKTYPMPLERVEVVEPVIGLSNNTRTDTADGNQEGRPLLRLIIKPEYWNKQIQKQLQCYVSGQGKALIIWKKNVAYIRAQKKLGVGRNRYNCTAPVTIVSNGEKKQGFYWYSQLWIKRYDNGRWYKE